MLKPRPYQRQAVDALYTYFQHYDGHPVVVLPTGCGKSLVLSVFCKEAIEQYPTTRIVVATHVKELVGQNYLEFMELWPFADAGVYSAGLNRRDTANQVLFCGIQSVYNKAYEIQRCDLLIIDECHTIPDSGLGMWRQFIAELLVINPYLKIIGLTATDFRMNSGSLVDGDDRIFTDIAFEYPLLKAIQEGYLCEIIPKHMDTSFDVSGVGKAGGEYKQGELERAVNVDRITASAIDEIILYGENRRSWLIFSSGNDHAGAIHDRLTQLGFRGACVTQDTSKGDRDAAVRGIKDFSIRYIVNTRVFTTGFNAKNIDLIADMGPTQSAGLHVQKLGRGSRPLYADGYDLETRDGRLAAIASSPKTNCLLLDFARNTIRHPPLDQIRARKKTKGSGDAPVKVCERCHAVCFAGVRLCPDCGNPFPEPELKISRSAAEAPVLSTQVMPEWHAVTGTTMRKHEKEGKPPSLRVTYHTVTGKFEEWICFEHDGYAREKAVAWHKTKALCAIPATIDEALEVDYPEPARVLVRQDGEWWRVIKLDYTLPEQGAAPAQASGTVMELDDFEIPF